MKWQEMQEKQTKEKDRIAQEKKELEKKVAKKEMSEKADKIVQDWKKQMAEEEKRKAEEAAEKKRLAEAATAAERKRLAEAARKVMRNRKIFERRMILLKERGVSPGEEDYPGVENDALFEAPSTLPKRMRRWVEENPEVARVALGTPRGEVERKYTYDAGRAINVAKDKSIRQMYAEDNELWGFLFGITDPKVLMDTMLAEDPELWCLWIGHNTDPQLQSCGMCDPELVNMILADIKDEQQAFLYDLTDVLTDTK
ncbi:MAG: hypothetical protein LE180_04640 [Endomicrobium sp.]|uniref:hypothetical protein n=1 Tax=Candidatus Endomicrobiellum pyrsonymphae TaxID=1408203 RepID=UPI00357BF7DA|nr:hypothetical protein [Endomicrobium sp.]